MKMKTLFGVLGMIVMIVGGVGLVKYLLVKVKKENDSEDNINTEKKTTSVIIREDNETSDLNSIKSDISESIIERHEEAKKIMEEAVNTIMSDELPETTKNEEIKRQLLDDIENL